MHNNTRFTHSITKMSAQVHHADHDADLKIILLLTANIVCRVFKIAFQVSVASQWGSDEGPICGRFLSGYSISPHRFLNWMAYMQVQTTFDFHDITCNVPRP